MTKEWYFQMSRLFLQSWNRAESLKMIHSAQFDAKKAATLTIDHLKWRAKTQPINQMAIDLMVGTSY